MGPATINGGGSGDKLDGGAGAAAMTGGTSSDTYIVDNPGDTVIERAGEGADAVETSLASYTLAANVEKLTFTGAGPFAGTGNAAKNTITGGSGNDTLDGGGAADILNGQAGDDILKGGAGADALTGGTGNGTYVVDHAGDTVIELAGEGTDTVKTSLASYTLDANVEKLTFTGTGPFAGAGNAAANTITGGSGTDTLDGGAGNDRLCGAGGRDTFVFMEGIGHDRILDFTATGASSDRIEIGGTAFTSFAELQAAGAVAQVGSNVVVTLGIDTLTITSVTLANIADDFLFV